MEPYAQHPVSALRNGDDAVLNAVPAFDAHFQEVEKKTCSLAAPERQAEREMDRITNERPGQNPNEGCDEHTPDNFPERQQQLLSA